MTYINEMINFVTQFSIRRFGLAKNRSMSKKDYYSDMECAYLAGTLSVMEEVFIQNKAGAFKEKDDIIAEMHIVYTELYKHFYKSYGFLYIDMPTLEKTINLSEDKCQNLN